MATCPNHPFETLGDIGRMSEDGPIEQACQFCMNDFDWPDLECLRAHEDGCTGSLRVIFGISGIAMVMCGRHETQVYERQDAIARNYR